MNSSSKTVLRNIIRGRGCSALSDLEELIDSLDLGWTWKRLKGIDTAMRQTVHEQAAITELLTNSMDACIEDRAAQQGTTPSSFSDPRESVAALYGVHGLENWEALPGRPNQASLTSQVGSLILERGDGKGLTVKIVDFGAGKNHRNFRNTFLTLLESDKRAADGQIGTFGHGSAVAAQYCEYQLVVSKTRSCDSWGVIILKKEVVSLSETKTETVLHVLSYGEGDNERFPTLDESEIEFEENFRIDRCDREVSEARDEFARKSFLLSAQEAYSRDYDDGGTVGFEFVPTDPANPDGAGRFLAVAHRRADHGTVRMLIGTSFTEPWSRNTIGGNNGIWQVLRKALMCAILPIQVVDNQIVSGKSMVGLGDKVSWPMFGMMSSLSSPTRKHGPLRRIDIPSVPVSLNRDNFGTVDVTLFYADKTWKREKDGKTMWFSSAEELLRGFPQIIRSGQFVGTASKESILKMVESTALANKVICLVQIDNINDDKIGRICGSGRTYGADGAYGIAMMECVVKAVSSNPEIQQIRSENEASLADVDELVRKCNELLAPKKPGEDQDNTIIDVGSIRACVRGDKRPDLADRPERVWLDYALSIKKGGDARQWDKDVNPTKVPQGTTIKRRVMTNCRNVNLDEYEDVVRFVRGSRKGIIARRVGSFFEISASYKSGVKRPVTILYSLRDSDGFESMPAAIKIQPGKPAEKLVVGPMPTIVRICSLHLQIGINDGIQKVSFTADAEPTFDGFSATVEHKGRLASIVVEPNPRGEGKWFALVPVPEGAKDGDTGILRIISQSSGVSQARLRMVAKKRPIGNDVKRKKKGSGDVSIKDEIIKPVDNDDDILRLVTASNEDECITYGVSPDKTGGIVTYKREDLAVINLAWPDLVEARRLADIEIASERDPQIKEAKRLYYRDFIRTMQVSMTSMYLQRREEAKKAGKEFSVAVFNDEETYMYLAAQAESTNLFTDVSSGKVIRRAGVVQRLTK